MPTNSHNLPTIYKNCMKMTKNTPLNGKYIDKLTGNSNHTSCAHYATLKDYTQQMLTKEKY